jgi:hypothetical protein
MPNLYSHMIFNKIHIHQTNSTTYYKCCTCVKKECCMEQVGTNGRQLGHLDSCRVLYTNRNKGMYQNNKTWLVARVWSVVTVVSVEIDGFSSFLK